MLHSSELMTYQGEPGYLLNRSIFTSDNQSILNQWVPEHTIYAAVEEQPVQKTALQDVPDNHGLVVRSTG